MVFSPPKAGPRYFCAGAELLHPPHQEALTALCALQNMIDRATVQSVAETLHSGNNYRILPARALPESFAFRLRLVPSGQS